MQAEKKATFFRQSGWLVIANTLSGVFLAAVHPVASRMPTDEWSIFATLLRLFAVLTIPAAGLQVTLARDAAAAINREKQRQLAFNSMTILKATFLLWLVILTPIAFFQQQIISALKLTNPAALWVTLLMGLFALWMPAFQGLVQGMQNFLFLGSSMILNGFGRFAGIAVIVLVFHGYSAGAMTGGLIGVAAATLAAAWPCRGLLATGFRASLREFDWSGWLKHIVPLTLGIGSILFMLNADMLFVQSHFSKRDAPFYGAAAMLGVALVTFTTPLAAVMFPKLVRSIAHSQKSDALNLALAGTAVLGLLGAIFCTLWPEFPLRLMFFKNPAFLKSAPLVPWFMWSMLPVTIANVLVNNLLARGRFQAVPWLALVAIGYGIALYFFVRSAGGIEPFVAFKRIIQMLGLFSSILLGVAVFFNWKQK